MKLLWRCEPENHSSSCIDILQSAKGLSAHQLKHLDVFALMEESLFDLATDKGIRIEVDKEGAEFLKLQAAHSQGRFDAKNLTYRTYQIMVT